MKHKETVSKTNSLKNLVKLERCRRAESVHRTNDHQRFTRKRTDRNRSRRRRTLLTRRPPRDVRSHHRTRLKDNVGWTIRNSRSRNLNKGGGELRLIRTVPWMIRRAKDRGRFRKTTIRKQLKTRHIIIKGGERVGFCPTLKRNLWRAISHHRGGPISN